MKEILLKIVAQLDEAKEEHQKARDVLNRVEQSIPLVQQKLIQDLVRNQVNKSLVEKQCIKANIPHNSSAYGIVLLEADEVIEGEEGHDLTQFVIQNIVSELVLSKQLGIVFEAQGWTGILYIQQERDSERQARLYYKHLCLIQEAISELIGIKVSVGVGKLVDSLQSIHESYSEANQVMKNRFFRGMGEIIYYHQDMTFKKADLKSWVKWEEAILSAMVDREKLCNTIQNIGLEMKREKITLEDMQEIWGNILCGMLKRFIEINRHMMPQLPQGIHIMHEVRQIKTLEQMQKWVVALYDLCEKQMEEERSPNQKYIEHIKQFIDLHYMDASLSVKHICEAIHISQSYLGQLFKKEVGKTFIQYLTEYRLEKAKELLKYTQLKTYEISDKVGNTDAHYFSAIFKKYTGYTPSEYRKSTRYAEQEVSPTDTINDLLFSTYHRHDLGFKCVLSLSDASHHRERCPYLCL